MQDGREYDPEFVAGVEATLPTHQIVCPSGIESQEHLGELGGAPRPLTVTIPQWILEQEMGALPAQPTDQQILDALMRAIGRAVVQAGSVDTTPGP